jgi:predicted O-methyltransferase YrrM
MPWDNRHLKNITIESAKQSYEYETPFTDFDKLDDNLYNKFNFGDDSKLKIGIDKNLPFIQILMDKYADEWILDSSSPNEYTTDPTINFSFPELDAFLLYAMIREHKPQNIVEIGSGQSTKVMIKALNANNQNSKLTCIEPFNDSLYELKRSYSNLTIIKDGVEHVNLSVFTDLGENDMLFIDSSHVLRPFSDVEYEYLHILPSLNPGVLVQIHDIFYPYSYPKEWVKDWRCVLTEQQCLLMFLLGNRDWECLNANNYTVMDKKLDFPKNIDESRGAGSFWMKRV